MRVQLTASFAASPSIMMLMPVAFEDLPAVPVEDPPKNRWTRAECERVLPTGVWDGKHLELIDGELIDKKMSKNRPHVIATMLAYQWLVAIFGGLRVLKEDPIDVSPEDNETNEPEPDLVVLRTPVTNLAADRPTPADVLLIIEVAATTLSFDLRKKARLYARAGISEYWVLDVNTRRMIVHREPKQGKYTSKVVYSEHESIVPLAAPDHQFRVASAFEPS